MLINTPFESILFFIFLPYFWWWCRFDLTQRVDAILLHLILLFSRRVECLWMNMCALKRKVNRFIVDCLKLFRKLFRLFQMNSVSPRIVYMMIVLMPYNLLRIPNKKAKQKKIVKCLIARHFVRVCSNYFTGMSRIFVLVYNCVLCIFIIYFGKCDVS